METIGIPRVLLEDADKKQPKLLNVKDFHSLEEILFYLIDINAVFYFHGKLSYAEDIQFDFKTGEVYIPFIQYKMYEEDTLTDRQRKILTDLYGDSYIRANYKLEKQTLVVYDKESHKYKFTEEPILLLLSDKNGGKVLGVLGIGEALPLTSQPNKKEDIGELFKLYLLASIKHKKYFSEKYITTPKFINKILGNESIPLYSEYITLPPFPSREYSKDVIIQSSLLDLEEINKPLETYRTLYKCKLFFSIVNNTEWIGFTRGEMTKLRKHEHIFAKYKRGDVCLVLTDDLFLI